jgi:hypothetical protein
LEQINKLLKEDGCWWLNPWWEDDHWYGSIAITKQDVLIAVEFLKSIFSKDWARSLGNDPLQHPFLQLIYFGKGLSQINKIYHLAERLRVVIKIDGHKSVLDNYKTIVQAHSANLEIFLAYVMSMTKRDVSFISAKSKKGRTPDILIKNNGKDFVIECKCIQDSDCEKWVSNYSNYYSSLLMNAIPAGCEIFYNLGQLKIDPIDYGYPELFSYQLAATIDALPLINFLRSINHFSSKYHYINFGSKGELYVLPTSDKFRSQLGSPEISQGFIGRRLVGNAIKKANLQISEFGKPGVAAVSYGSPPDIGALKQMLPRLFDAHRKEYSLLMGVIIFPMQNLLKYVRPIWIANPFSEFSSEEFGIPESFVNILDPHI